MAGILPSFLSSGQLVIRMGNLQIAYANAISWNDNMTLAPVGGIGASHYHAIEPVQYAASGSMVITAYSEQAFSANKPGNFLPGNLQSTVVGTDGNATHNGNSLLNKEFMHPALLMVSRTFDIDVYFKSLTGSTANTIAAGTNTAGGLVYTLKDCRINSYGSGFSPGSLVQESVGFLCLQIINHMTQGNAKPALT